MGTVYLATRDDDQYQQRVAIKVLRAGRTGLGGDEAVRRFRSERQILARLEHPHIARLYDSGETEDGRPYLVMELVEGEPIDRYCDRRRLPLEERIALFRKVCDAVEHAHQSLLVHRDLKPPNILVTADGTPKLLDFGISKRLEGSSGAEAAIDLTLPGARLMTPSYASPEQVRGESITTASDVYSLGVLLYELTTGRSPYSLSGLPLYQVEEAVCEREPERPSQACDPGAADAEEAARARGLTPKSLRRRLVGDLDNIVAMALRKEPERRYPTAAALSADLARHLRDLPVAARPDTLGYRLRKLARRRRLALGAAAVLLAATAGLVTSLLAQGRRLEAERDKALFALSFLMDASVAANPYLSGDGVPTAQDLLDQGARQAETDLARQPDVQAALFDAFGQINASFGRFDQAESLLERAVALRERHLGKGSQETEESRAHLDRLHRLHPDGARKAGLP